jgi:hypothetical protein
MNNEIITLILRSTSFGDAHRIVTLLTDEGTKINAVAHNSRKSSKRFSGGLEPFDIGKATLKLSNSRGRSRSIIWSLESFLLTSPLPNLLPTLRTDLEAFIFGATLLEITEALVVETETLPQSSYVVTESSQTETPFSLLITALTKLSAPKLSSQSNSLERSKNTYFFIVNLLTVLGFLNRESMPPRSLNGLLSLINEVEDLIHRPLRTKPELLTILKRVKLTH